MTLTGGRAAATDGRDGRDGADTPTGRTTETTTMTIALCHSNECGGTNITPEARIYWNEGYSATIVAYVDGRRETVQPEEIDTHPLASDIIGADAEMRMMTAAEEREWDDIMTNG